MMTARWRQLRMRVLLCHFAELCNGIPKALIFAIAQRLIRTAAQEGGKNVKDNQQNYCNHATHHH
jgi:hypothetical protein